MKTTKATGLASLIATFLLYAALAHGTEVADELRQAARLQRNGDTAAATAIWKRWAERGNADAAYNMAVVHQYGDGVPKNAGEAFRWYRRAAALGDHISEYQVGLMYQNGEGIPVDHEEAHRWLTAHRRHHAHHAGSEQMQAWRRQAAAMIEAGEMREALVRSRAESARILAELRRRAEESGSARSVVAMDSMRGTN